MTPDELIAAAGRATCFAADKGDHSAVIATLAAGDQIEPGGTLYLARQFCDHFNENQTSLRDETRAVLVLALMPRGFDTFALDDIPRLAALVRPVDLFAQLADMDGVLKTYLYPQLLDSDTFKKAQSDWGAMSHKDKLAYGSFVGRLFSAISQMPKPGVSAFSEERDQHGMVALGRCEERPGGCVDVQLNVWEDCAFKDFQTFNTTLYHELEHGMQIHYAHLMRTGSAGRIPREFRTAAILMAAMLAPDVCEYSMVTLATYAAYPLEDHAEKNALHFGAVVADRSSHEDIIAQAKNRLKAQGFMMGAQRGDASKKKGGPPIKPS